MLSLLLAALRPATCCAARCLYTSSSSSSRASQWDHLTRIAWRRLNSCSRARWQMLAGVCVPLRKRVHSCPTEVLHQVRQHATSGQTYLYRGYPFLGMPAWLEQLDMLTHRRALPTMRVTTASSLTCMRLTAGLGTQTPILLRAMAAASAASSSAAGPCSAGSAGSKPPPVRRMM